MDTASKPSTSRFGALLIWIGVAFAATGLLVVARDILDKSHAALAYLLIVLVGTSQTGRRGGFALALICFVLFNFFLLPPYHALHVADRRDWLVLLAFLLTSIVAAQLLYRAQNQARIAESRSQEIDQLSMLGAETLSAGRAEEAVASIADVVQTTLGLQSCEIFSWEGTPPRFRLVASAPAGVTDENAPTTRMFDHIASNGTVAVERTDGTAHILTPNPDLAHDPTWMQTDARAIAIPLLVRGRGVGIMRLTADRMYLEPEQRRFARVLAYYAALAVERVRLIADAERVDALRAAHDLKDSFVAAISHDLRTPLTTIKGLAHELAPDERAAIIEAEADRLNDLVRDVLDLSQLNAGELRVSPEMNTAEDLVGAALGQLAGFPRAEYIRARLPEDHIVVGYFDFVHSLRCLVNLIENALKYSPDTAHVDVEVEQNADTIAFKVLDRGPGINAEHAERIFEPFVRASNTRKGGAGLGLAISLQLARAQNGDVTYAPRPGGGSIFTLILPAS